MVCDACYQESKSTDGCRVLRLIAHGDAQAHHQGQRVGTARQACKNHTRRISLQSVVDENNAANLPLEVYVADPPLVLAATRPSASKRERTAEDQGDENVASAESTPRPRMPSLPGTPMAGFGYVMPGMQLYPSPGVMLLGTTAVGVSSSHGPPGFGGITPSSLLLGTPEGRPETSGAASELPAGDRDDVSALLNDYEALPEEAKAEWWRQGITDKLMDVLYNVHFGIALYKPGSKFVLRSLQAIILELWTLLQQDQDPAWRTVIENTLEAAHSRALGLEQTATELEHTLQKVIEPSLKAAEHFYTSLLQLKTDVEDAARVRHESAKQIKHQAAFEAHEKVQRSYRVMSAFNSLMEQAKTTLGRDFAEPLASTAGDVARRFGELPGPVSMPGPPVAVIDCKELEDASVKEACARQLRMLNLCVEKTGVLPDITLPPTPRTGVVPGTEFSDENLE
ncbi:hypothetical protein GPECTOR_155g78 [Gonium pectorale]|uniref:Uncharacterized protein n=1 Tax=Gonium pectorale TaxID=33097 RepID=A0A150FXQ4_GONPE|nr:hypothetical protein GPECTOR_155g78 [Gonium pectorale]|eukprot:KXZ42368.1 hypothetical protein GPECTOR_155g78 [Gonium pectorale]